VVAVSVVRSVSSVRTLSLGSCVGSAAELVVGVVGSSADAEPATIAAAPAPNPATSSALAVTIVLVLLVVVA
jgi:Ca2+/Na+ antiporter